MADCEEATTTDYHLAELTNKVLCRTSQMKRLLELFGKGNEYVFPSIFLYGHTGTGKTFVVRQIMEHLKLPHVLVNCIECYSSRLLYESILESIEQLSGFQESIWKKCDTMTDFIRYFKNILGDNSYETIYIIFDKAERLRNMDFHLLPVFLRLSEITQMNVSVLLITELIWEKFQVGTGFLEPVQVHFSEYTKEELVEIMSLDCPEDYSKEFFITYCRLLLSVFYMACRDLNELRHLALLNFPKYCEPLKGSENAREGTDVRKLWKNIEPHLKKALSTIYLREISSSQWEAMQQSESIDYGKPKPALELPYYSKYLLIAAYLASHNPAKSDKRFFCKQTDGRMSRRAKSAAKTKAMDNKLSGPKGFPLDRLMAIFYSIVEVVEIPRASLLSQVSSLVTLNLLAKASADDQIDAAKFKCVVSFDFVQSVAKTVDFDLIQYLFDFT